MSNLCLRVICLIWVLVAVCSSLVYAASPQNFAPGTVGLNNTDVYYRDHFTFTLPSEFELTNSYISLRLSEDDYIEISELLVTDGNDAFKIMCEDALELAGEAYGFLKPPISVESTYGLYGEHSLLVTRFSEGNSKDNEFYLYRLSLIVQVQDVVLLFSSSTRSIPMSKVANENTEIFKDMYQKEFLSAVEKFVNAYDRVEKNNLDSENDYKLEYGVINLFKAKLHPYFHVSFSSLSDIAGTLTIQTGCRDRDLNSRKDHITQFFKYHNDDSGALRVRLRLVADRKGLEMVYTKPGGNIARLLWMEFLDLGAQKNAPLIISAHLRDTQQRLNDQRAFQRTISQRDSILNQIKWK